MNLNRAVDVADGSTAPRAVSARLRAIRDQMTPRHAGVYVVWITSVLASMTALYDLAKDYGGWGPVAALLFPVPVDIYWITALNTALDSSLAAAARLKAAAHATAALLVSVAGNILYHELHAGDIRLGSWSALTVGVISSVPLVVAAALTHLAALGRAATAPAGKAKRAATAPPRKTATMPDRAALPRVTVPAMTDDRATTPGATAPPAAPEGDGMPEPLKKGGRPDPIAVQAARDEWHSGVKAGRIHSPRSLEKAVNERFGYPVIGRTSAATVIGEERERRRTA